MGRKKSKAKGRHKEFTGEDIPGGTMSASEMTGLIPAGSPDGSRGTELAKSLFLSGAGPLQKNR